MATGWKCIHTASVVSQTDTTATIKVTCKWKNDGYTHAVNYVSAWVYCGNSSYKVKDNGSVDARSSTSQEVDLGSHTFTINKKTTSQSIACYAKIISNSSYHDGEEVSTSKNVTVSAKTSYIVSYNANGGSGQPSNQTKWHGTTLKLSSTTPKRTGHEFQGWATSAKGSVAYAAGGDYKSNAAVTLYAVWKADTYTVSYNINGGQGQPPVNQTKTYGADLKLSNSTPTKTGHQFQGWSTTLNGKAIYSAGATYTTNAPITLYAVWAADTYKVTYNANGGSGAPSEQTKTYGVNLTLSNTIPTRANYNFKGCRIRHRCKLYN